MILLRLRLRLRRLLIFDIFKPRQLYWHLNFKKTDERRVARENKLFYLVQRVTSFLAGRSSDDDDDYGL
jgi:hypothetical protein